METLASILAALLGLLGLSASNTPVPSRTDASSLSSPTLFAPEDLGQAGRITFSPAFSPDGDTIFFTQGDCDRVWNCPQLLMRSRRTADGWSRPERVDLPQQARADWPSVSPDGRTLYFSWAPRRARHAGMNVIEDFDIYRLKLDVANAVPEPIDDPDINRIRGGDVRTTRFVNNETAPLVTRSGDLYFWTERLDGIGRRDIYVAKSDGPGTFARPVPLPAPINDEGNNEGSWVSPGGRLMLLNTSRSGSDEAPDLHVSTLEDGQWTEPRALGASVNSPHFEIAGRISPDGKTLVFTSDRPVGRGEPGLFQIWQIPVAEVPVLVDAIERLSDGS